MENVLIYIIAISGLAYLVVLGWRSFSKTKSAVRWLKGLNLKKPLSDEEVFQLLEKIDWPSKKSVSRNAEGKIVVITDDYSYVTELTQDENHNTVIGFIVNWLEVGKRKRHKVAMDLDELYLFVSQEIEGNKNVHAMKVYKGNIVVNKTLKILCVVFSVSIILIAIFLYTDT